MADSSLLSSIIAGNDPLAPQMVPAYMAAQQSQQMLDPNYGMNQGPFGALARVLAGATGNGQGALKDAVANVTAQRTAAQPEIAKLLASPDAYSTLASSPEAYSPLARAAVLNGATPNTVAEARLHGAQALYNAAQGGLLNTMAAPMPSVYGASAARPSPGNASTAAPAAQPAAFPQDYTGRPQAEPDVASIAAMPPVMQAQALARMNPAQKAALAAMIAKYRAQGGGNAAVRPPT